MIPFYETKQVDLQVWCNSQLEFPPHLHSAAEMLYIIRGSISVTIHGQEQIMNTGAFAVIFPNIIHSYQIVPGKSNEIMLMICSTNLLINFTNVFKKNQPVNPFLSPHELPSDAVYALEKLRSAIRDGAPLILLSAWVQVAAAYTLPKLELKKNIEPDNTDLTFRLIQYLSANFQHSISLDSLSRELNISKYYLSHIFSKKLGLHFHDYLNSLRLEYAAHRIRTSQDNFTQISQDSGFDSQRTFNRVFKEKYGVSPRNYRSRCP